jgi:hypothetical protein
VAQEYEKIPELNPIRNSNPNDVFHRELVKMNDDLRQAIKLIKMELERLQKEKQDA